ncbi:hypothetical protein E8E11_009648 [Didymella keratinophila]|nr:hypothetical protein E8E11_009648 [Didymella keratinophila]
MPASVPRVSRDTFLHQNVISAHSEDKYINDKCTFCWGSYDEEHPAVRILPCDHVFGHGSVVEFTKSTTRNACPYCKVLLFRRPSKLVILAQLLLTTMSIMTLMMIPNLYRSAVIARDFWSKQHYLVWTLAILGAITVSSFQSVELLNLGLPIPRADFWGDFISTAGMGYFNIAIFSYIAWAGFSTHIL